MVLDANSGALEWSIAAKIRYAGWAKKYQRFRTLDMYDRFIDGTFYNHLPYTFWDETTGQNEYVPIANRAPSCKFNIPKMLGKQIARKLFAGRHIPSIVHSDNKDIIQRAEALAEECNLDMLMMSAVKKGMVGSAALQFKVVAYGDNKARMIAQIWESKFCRPKFDEIGELEVLRVNYPVIGAYFLEEGTKRDSSGDEIAPASNYWFVRDFTKQTEITYLPVKESKWNPLNWTDPLLKPDESKIIEPHNFDFVPAHWFVLNDGDKYDGECVFASAMSNLIEMDYRLSQIGMGVGYNSAPQVVVKGNLVSGVGDGDEDASGSVTRSVSKYIQIEADRKDSEGFSTTGNDIKLLEMTGTGVEAGLGFVFKLKDLVIEQLCASRKDPNKLTTAMSGKGLELIDEEYSDNVSEHRTIYCRNGYLKILKKMCHAALKAQHPLMSGKGINEEVIDGLTLGYPTIHEIGPSEMAQLIQGLDQGITAKIVDVAQAQDIFRSQVDVPIVSANRNYQPEQVESGDKDGAPTDAPPTDTASPAL